MAAPLQLPTGKLLQVKTQLSLWQSCIEKAMAHLSSLSNLASQLEVIRKGKLGVLSQQLNLSNLLELKLIKSMENSLNHIHEQKYVYSLLFF